MTRRILVLSFGIATSITACRGESTPKAADSASQSKSNVETTPPIFRVRFETSRGPFVVEAHRDWAPNGVDRFYQLVKSGFYENARFFRVIPGFVAQFGMHADPAVSRQWQNLTITDDPVVQSNKRGFVTYAKSGAPNSRSTQLFVNLRDNVNLDADGFAPIGFITEGMAVVDSLYSGYAEESNNQQEIRAQGNAFLEKNYPKLDFIRTTRVEEVTADSAAKRDSTKK